MLKCHKFIRYYSQNDANTQYPFKNKCTRFLILPILPWTTMAPWGHHPNLVACLVEIEQMSTQNSSRPFSPNVSPYSRYYRLHMSTNHDPKNLATPIRQMHKNSTKALGHAQKFSCYTYYECNTHRSPTMPPQMNYLHPSSTNTISSLPNPPPQLPTQSPPTHQGRSRQKGQLGSGKMGLRSCEGP